MFNVIKSSRSVLQQPNLFKFNFLPRYQSNPSFTFSLQRFGKDFSKDSNSDIIKQMKGAQRVVDLHINKLKHPEQYGDDWNSLSDFLKNGRMQYWSSEIGNHSKIIEDGQSELNRRSIQERIKRGGKR